MTEELRQVLTIEGQDQASASFKEIIATIERLGTAARKTGEILSKSFGADLTKNFTALRTSAETFTGVMVEGAEKVSKSIMGDIKAAAELRETLASVTAEQKAMSEAIRSTMTAGAAASTAEARNIRNAATGRARASAGAMRENRKVWSETERRERAEVEHVKTLRRERASLRREIASAAAETWHKGKHAIKSVNHPIHESAGLYAGAAAIAGVEAARKTIESSLDLDSSLTRLRMFAPSIDTGQARAQALRDSIDLGMDASKIVDVQAKAIRDGIAPEIARTLPASIAAAAQVMGGDVERLTDSLAEGLQEAGWMGEKQRRCSPLSEHRSRAVQLRRQHARKDGAVRPGGWSRSRKGTWPRLGQFACLWRCTERQRHADRADVGSI